MSKKKASNRDDFDVTCREPVPLKTRGFFVAPAWARLVEVATNPAELLDEKRPPSFGHVSTWPSLLTRVPCLVPSLVKENLAQLPTRTCWS